jgi:hypothetical protein
MSKILKVSNGDYRLQVQNAGNIILDTGNAVGTVTITGNLDVKGVQTTVESSTTTVADNILSLNVGQTGNGISGTLGYQAGIEIKRGNYQTAQFVFKENVQHYNPVTSTEVNGTFVLKTIDGALSGLQTNSITTDGTTNLVFDLQGGTSILSIVNSTNYESRVTHPNDIPNRKFITDYVSASSGVANVDRIYFPLGGTFGTSQSSIQATNGVLSFNANQVTIAQISAGGLTIGNLNVSGDTLTNTGSNNLILAANNNQIEVAGVMNLDHQASAPAGVSGVNRVYSSNTQGTGSTGLYFTNTKTNGELISSKKALLYAILF